jgi:hypothetical protein
MRSGWPADLPACGPAGLRTARRRPASSAHPYTHRIKGWGAVRVSLTHSHPLEPLPPAGAGGNAGDTGVGDGRPAGGPRRQICNLLVLLLLLPSPPLLSCCVVPPPLVRRLASAAGRWPVVSCWGREP